MTWFYFSSGPYLLEDRDNLYLEYKILRLFKFGSFTLMIPLPPTPWEDHRFKDTSDELFNIFCIVSIIFTALLVVIDCLPNDRYGRPKRSRGGQRHKKKEEREKKSDEKSRRETHQWQAVIKAVCGSVTDVHAVNLMN